MKRLVILSLGTIVLLLIVVFLFFLQPKKDQPVLVITPTPTAKPNTRPKEAFEEERAFQRVTHPDVFLANNTPYETNIFRITYQFTSSPTDHFFFVVDWKIQNEDIGKVQLNEWLASLGLSLEQIATLDIRYTPH